jgi:aerobic-type carbon monoxide dehydrogenase small subunit (CoxS/CutS family)
MKRTIQFTLNGQPRELTVDGDRRLLWVLRTELGLTGTKYGCGEGDCGACTVLVDGEAVRSCRYPFNNVEGKEVLTIEGLASGDRLHPLQQAFVDHDALQCGFCTPGMIMTAYSELSRGRTPPPEVISFMMEDNLCRCGAHTRIIQAIQTAALEMNGGGKR